MSEAGEVLYTLFLMSCWIGAGLTIGHLMARSIWRGIAQAMEALDEYLTKRRGGE